MQDYLSPEVVKMISKEEALRLIGKSSRYSHSLDVAAILDKLAERLGEDRTTWEIVGLLHDLDYDQVRDNMKRHGIVTSEILRDKLPEDCLYAIKSHDYRTGFKPKGKLDTALIIADSLAVIIERIKNRESLSAKKLRREIERSSAKAPWHKENLLRCKKISLSIPEPLRLAVEAFRKNS